MFIINYDSDPSAIGALNAAVDGGLESIRETTARMWKRKQILQSPPELASFLGVISQHKILSFVNVGTFSGLVFYLIARWLTKLNGPIRAVTIDPGPQFHEYEEAKQNLPGIESVVGTSFDLRCQAFDLCFIDGNHYYEWVDNDFNNLGIYSKICAFHDVTNSRKWEGGPKRHWDNMKNFQKGWTFFEIAHPTERCGIGVMVRL